MSETSDYENFDLPEFGHLYFDGYVAAKWDPHFPLTKDQQKRSLVESWTRLGKFGRNKYSDEDILWPTNGHPSYISQDLLSGKDRKLDGQITSTLWIRTWFGKKDDVASQDAADVAYERLVEAAMWDDAQSQYPRYRAAIEPGFVFDARSEFGHGSATTTDENGDADPDIVDGIALARPGSVPSYLITALMHCPGQFDGNSDPRRDDWRHFSPTRIEAELPGIDKSQRLLVCVADRKACEEGLVLFLAINHRGQILPFRIRDRAIEVFQYEANWMDGQTLDENTLKPDDDVEYYMHKGDGWGS
ncbi:hypothetical protein N7492_001507 [Penicillium capsulatum]|uniref:Uncharacterized protein n=1 Tax=Penicillium capsulatum TaxID=69766 RepID=A0A9W9IUU0_9EURO|nr:hypothetical protein N7492_001507 [Penicillium capsulatum]KAJ6129440.1 hypothetical protein N7512_002220 [Penicillium capsulatum]